MNQYQWSIKKSSTRSCLDPTCRWENRTKARVACAAAARRVSASVVHRSGRWKRYTSDLEVGWFTLWLCQNSYWKWPFIGSFPVKKWWFSIVMLNYQRVTLNIEAARPKQIEDSFESWHETWSISMWPSIFYLFKRGSNPFECCAQLAFDHPFSISCWATIQYPDI